MLQRDDGDVLARGLGQLRSTGFEVAFGGTVAEADAPLSEFAGTRGNRLRGLSIEPKEGLGGRALVDRAPRATVDYENTAWITPRYGAHVRSEGIVTLLAIPIVVKQRVRALVYAGHRVPVQIGNAVADRVAGVARRCAWELTVRDEVDRRVEMLEAEGAMRQAESDPDLVGLRERFTELRELARSIEDPATRARLEAISRGLTRRSDCANVPQLSSRELDVLTEVAMGRSNADVADRLMLAEATVKKYLATAMQKLGASNRFDAVLKARAGGVLP